MVERAPKRLGRAVAIGVLTLCGHARAECTEAPGQAERILKLAGEGRALYDKGQIAEARERFATADGIACSPVITLYLARSERDLGHLVAASRAYARVVVSSPDSHAPDVFQRAVAEAREEQKKLGERMPHVALEAPGLAGASFELDGVAVEVTPSPTPVDPGKHVASVAWQGKKAQQTFDAKEYETVKVRLALPLETSTPTPTPPPRRPAETQSSSGLFTAGLVLGGLGLAGLAAGGITGALSVSKTNAIKSRCDGVHCDPADKSDGATAVTLGNVSTIAFVAGGVLTATGVTLVVIGRRATKRVEPTAEVVLSPHGVAWRSAF